MAGVYKDDQEQATEPDGAGVGRHVRVPGARRSHDFDPLGGKAAVNVVLVSTYDLGRQPFGLASPAALLAREGCAVASVDLAVESFPGDVIAAADLVAFYVPMHTATRLAVDAVERVRGVNPRAHLAFYGTYASLNEPYLRRLGGRTILGGEFEEGLVSLARRISSGRTPIEGAAQEEPVVSLRRQRFVPPDRSDLPPLEKYARLRMPDGSDRLVGCTEASRGCVRRCRHCPVASVYRGTLRIVPADVVLADIRQQVAAGARHITFADPDFFNGPLHSLTIVRAAHDAWPDLTYDATIRVENLLRHERHLEDLLRTGCTFVTTAVESFDDRVLSKLGKRHTGDGFAEALRACRRIGLTVNPTFVPFTPWTSRSSYVDFLCKVLELDLVEEIAPVQYAIRLLIPAASGLLDLGEVRGIVGSFDERALAHPWRHFDPEVDRLQDHAFRAVAAAERLGLPRSGAFRQIWGIAGRTARSSCAPVRLPDAVDDLPSRAAVPFLTEPWYC